MDIRQIYAVEVRAEGSDKTLIRIDGLNEAECNKVFDRIQFPTRGEGYEKLKLWNRGMEEDEIMRRSPLIQSGFKPIPHKAIRQPEPPAIQPSTIDYTPSQRKQPKKGGSNWGERNKTE